jgi:diguanylate cyclase (GGDEF)-like protein/excisionase family DNA binding protein
MTMNTPPESQPTLSVTEAARVVGVHPNTLRAWTSQGRIRAYRINRRGDRRYRRDDLDAFLEATAEGPAGDAAQTGFATSTDDDVPGVDVLALVRREVNTAAAIAGGEVGASGLDGALTRTTRIVRTRHGHAFVGIWERDDERLVPRAAAGDQQPLSVDLGGRSLVARALHAEPTLEEPVDGSAQWITHVGSGAVACAAPIHGPSGPWGVLVVVDTAPHPVNAAVLPALAMIIGGVVRTTRLVDEATRGRRQADALRHVAIEFAHELDLDRILAAILEHGSSLFRADRAAIFLGRPGGRIHAALARGLSEEFVTSIRVFHTWSVPAEAIAERRPVAVRGYLDDPRGEWLRDGLLGEGIDTICSAPLFDGEEPIGYLNLYNDMPREWSSDELDTLAAFATQASVAIRNAQNFRRTESWAAQLQSIQHLGGQLSRLASTSEIGAAIIDEIERLIEFHNVRVYMIQGDELGAIAVRGKIGDYVNEDPEALKLAVGEGITGWVAQHGIAQYLPDADADPRAMTIPGTDSIEESMLLAPMMFEGHVLGVIVLSKLGLDRFTESDLRLLVIFANAAAQALATAEASERLREQSAALERRLRSQRALLQITESILTTLDSRRVLEGITERLGDLVWYDNVCIELLDSRTDTLRPIIARGVDADRYMQPWEAGEEGLATWVVANAAPALVVDELKDARVAIFPEQGSVEGSLIAVPLWGPQGVVGVLSVERMGTENRFDEDDFELVQLFAGQVSIALRNAEHYRAARVRAETDGLTGLHNYASFRDRLGALVFAGEPFSLLMLDLDGFRAVNAAYLYRGGNVVLQRAAAAIRSVARESDEVFRFGGDEFCVLLPRTDVDGARIVAERVREAIAGVEPPTRARRKDVPRITVSVGIATFPEDGATADLVVDVASRGAYFAKHEGGDRVATAAEGLLIADEFEPTGPTRVESEVTAIEELLDAVASR